MIGAEAAERALALAGARQPAGRRCPVVLDAFVAASFLGFIGGMLSADAVQRGRSLFAGREGEEIAASVLRVADDGTHPDGLRTAPYDGEGSPRRRTGLIEGGRLATYLFDARTARKAGRETTGSASRASYRSPPSVGTANLVLEPGELDLAELCRQAGDGLYVTDVAGLHSGVNPISGTFSVGATGRLIEGGELGDARTRADDRERSRVDAALGARGRVRGALGAVRGQRPDRSDIARRDGGLRRLARADDRSPRQKSANCGLRCPSGTALRGPGRPRPLLGSGLPMPFPKEEQ